jgi:hypothetical protein
MSDLGAVQKVDQKFGLFFVEQQQERASVEQAFVEGESSVLCQWTTP